MSSHHPVISSDKNTNQGRGVRGVTAVTESELPSSSETRGFASPILRLSQTRGIASPILRLSEAPAPVSDERRPGVQ